LLFPPIPKHTKPNQQQNNASALLPDDNEKALLIVSEAYGHEDLKQTREYLGLPLDDLDEVQRKRAEYMSRIKDRMQKGLAPEKDFSIRISR